MMAVPGMPTVLARAARADCGPKPRGGRWSVAPDAGARF